MNNLSIIILEAYNEYIQNYYMNNEQNVTID